MPLAPSTTTAPRETRRITRASAGLLLLVPAAPPRRGGAVLAQPRRAHPDHRVRLVEPRVGRARPVAPVEVDAEGAGLLVPIGLVVAELALRPDVRREQAMVAVDTRPRDEVVREREPPRQAVLVDRVVVERTPVRTARRRVVHHDVRDQPRAVGHAPAE